MLSMMIPLLHQGMLIGGIPYSEASCTVLKVAAPPMAPAIFRAINSAADEIKLCHAQGKRIAQLASQLIAPKADNLTTRTKTLDQQISNPQQLCTFVCHYCR